MAERVLIVAADAALRAAVVRALAPAGYAVELAEGAKRAREVLAANDIALTILAPEGMGPAAGDLARELRAAGRLLVIGEPATAMGRRAGSMIAGDVRPATRFDPAELLAQTRALLATEDVVEPAAELLRFDPFTVDPSGYAVRDADGREISLTRAEFALLLAFVRHPGRVLTRDQLFDLAWSRRAEAYDRTVDVLVGRLRRKLEADPKKPRLIVTVPGIGYKFLAKRMSATRRLTTILAADVAGYSRLTGADEEGTLARLGTLRREAIDPAISSNRGRVVKTTGDGILVEFSSAVDAVRCAVEVQRALAERNVKIPAEKRIEFRIGIAAVGGFIDYPCQQKRAGR